MWGEKPAQVRKNASVALKFSKIDFKPIAQSLFWLAEKLKALERHVVVSHLPVRLFLENTSVSILPKKTGLTFEKIHLKIPIFLGKVCFEVNFVEFLVGNE